MGREVRQSHCEGHAPVAGLRLRGRGETRVRCRNAVPVTLSLPRLLRDAKARGEKLAMVSLYDAPSAALACEARVDLILVGDSLGNTILGYESPVRVTMNDMLHHTKAVARGVQDTSRSKVPIIVDLPFGSYTNVRIATQNEADQVRAGAHALKLEGAGPSSVRAVRALTEMGVPVVGHLGFTPQSSLLLEGVVQGKTGAAASRLLEGAQRLEDAGCCSVVLEVVPSEVARCVTRAVGLDHRYRSRNSLRRAGSRLARSRGLHHR